jgi:hypothetical protein
MVAARRGVGLAIFFVTTADEEAAQQNCRRQTLQYSHNSS